MGSCLCQVKLEKACFMEELEVGECLLKLNNKE